MDAKLREKAEKLGITVDSRWSDTTLQQRIDEKEADIKVQGSGNIIPGSGVDDKAEIPKEALFGAAMYQGKVLPTEATPKAVRAAAAQTGDEKLLLTVKANQLGIAVDDKWDANRLRGEIQFSREGRADLQVKGAVPPGEICDVNYDPATKADKQGKMDPGVIPPQTVEVPGVTIAGQPAVQVAGPTGGAVAKNTVVAS